MTVDLFYDCFTSAAWKQAFYDIFILYLTCRVEYYFPRWQSRSIQPSTNTSEESETTSCDQVLSDLPLPPQKRRRSSFTLSQYYLHCVYEVLLCTCTLLQYSHFLLLHTSTESQREIMYIYNQVILHINNINLIIRDVIVFKLPY